MVWTYERFFKQVFQNADRCHAQNGIKKAPDEVKTALEKGDVSALTGSLNEADRQKVNAVLSDPAAMRKILSDPKVKELLKSFESGR